MKKFFKFLLGAGATIAVIGSILYFLKNVLMKDYLEDYDDDDFDNDLYSEESDEDDRDYVTINVPEKESGEEETSGEDSSETQEDDLSAFDSETE